MLVDHPKLQQKVGTNSNSLDCLLEHIHTIRADLIIDRMILITHLVIPSTIKEGLRSNKVDRFHTNRTGLRTIRVRLTSKEEVLSSTLGKNMHRDHHNYTIKVDLHSSISTVFSISNKVHLYNSILMAFRISTLAHHSSIIRNLIIRKEDPLTTILSLNNNTFRMVHHLQFIQLNKGFHQFTGELLHQ